MNNKFNLPKGFTITAHTGCENTPMNSAESMRKGAEYAEIVEVDLNFTRNNEPVLAHSFVKKDSLTLDEAFSELAKLPGTKMNIDVKIGPDLKAVYDCALKHNVQNRILYTGIENEKLVSAKRDTPKIPFYLNVTVTRLKMLKKEYIDFLVSETKKHGAIGLNMSYKPCTKELVEAFHKEGLTVSLYTCNDIKSMLKALNLGVDNITTKNPAMLKKLVESPFVYTGHTGCMNTADNSLESIEAGIKNGTAIIEFDLNFDKDGNPVLSHDEPKGGEIVLEKAFIKLSEYPEIKANIDVKTTVNLSAVQELAEKFGVLHQIFYTGISEKYVEAAKTQSPKIPYYLNLSVDVPPKKQTEEYLMSLVKKVKDCGAIGINFKKTNASEKLVDFFHKNGLLVSIWTVNGKKELYKFLSFSPDNITTKRPDRLKNILSE